MNIDYVVRTAGATAITGATQILVGLAVGTDIHGHGLDIRALDI